MINDNEQTSQTNEQTSQGTEQTSQGTEQFSGSNEQSSHSNEQFSRTERLLGEELTSQLSHIRVIVFGIGGVGSWCAEALVRTGVHHLTIVDADKVSVSNINRQLLATHKTVGESKVVALKERLLDINPNADITTIDGQYTNESNDRFHLDEYDYIIDAIDSLEDKANLILNATNTRAVLFSSMGAALKLDTTRIKVDEFWKAYGCPLAKALRTKFKKRKTFPKKKFKVVFSDELLENQGDTSETLTLYNKVHVNGSLCHITATFGMHLCGLVVQDVCKKHQRA